MILDGAIIASGTLRPLGTLWPLGSTGIALRPLLALRPLSAVSAGRAGVTLRALLPLNTLGALHWRDAVIPVFGIKLIVVRVDEYKYKPRLRRRHVLGGNAFVFSKLSHALNPSGAVIIFEGGRGCIENNHPLNRR